MPRCGFRRDRFCTLEMDAPVNALVIIDMQCGFIEGDQAIPDAGGVRRSVHTLVHAARRAEALVVHLQNDGPTSAVDAPGSAGWQLWAHFGPDDVVVRKSTDDAFEGTVLGALLEERGVRAIAVCGVLSEMCVAVTARAALGRGLRVVIAHGAHGTYDTPAGEGGSEPVPAAMAARVAEWSLGDQVEIVASAESVAFAPPR